MPGSGRARDQPLAVLLRRQRLRRKAPRKRGRELGPTIKSAWDLELARGVVLALRAQQMCSYVTRRKSEFADDFTGYGVHLYRIDAIP